MVKQQRLGIVISNKMQKSVVIAVNIVANMSFIQKLWFGQDVI